jgi:hypothetical protein
MTASPDRRSTLPVMDQRRFALMPGVWLDEGTNIHNEYE